MIKQAAGADTEFQPFDHHPTGLRFSIISHFQLPKSTNSEAVAGNHYSERPVTGSYLFSQQKHYERAGISPMADSL